MFTGLRRDSQFMRLPYSLPGMEGRGVRPMFSAPLAVYYCNGIPAVTKPMRILFFPNLMHPINNTVSFGSLCRVLTTALLISVPVAASGQVILDPFRKTPSAPKTSPLEREILEVSAAWVDASMRGDRQALGRLQTDDFVSIQLTNKGVAIFASDKQKEAAQAPSANRPKIERSLEGVRVRQYGDDVVVLTAVATFRARGASGQLGVSRAVITEIWVKQDGAWRISHFQPTNIPVKVAPKK